MADKRTLTIEILGDASKATKAFDQVDDGSKKMSASIGKVAAAAGGVLAAGAAFSFLKGSMSDAAAEGQEMELLANTMRNTVGATDAQIEATENWVTAMQNATGIADGTLRPALGKLLIAGRDVEQAQKDMAVAADIAAARNIDLETVVNAMSKAAQGNTGALGKLGIATKGAAGETLSYDQILKNAAKTMGGAAAAAADTAAGRAAILQAKFADLKENIGSALIPVMETLTSVLTKITDWFNKLSPGMQKTILVAGGLLLAVGPLISVVTSLTAVVGGLSTAMAFLAANPIVLIIAGIAALVAGVVVAYKNVDWFRAFVDGAFKQIVGVVNTLRGAWSTAWNAITSAVQGAWNVIKPIVDAVRSAIDTIQGGLDRLTGGSILNESQRRQIQNSRKDVGMKAAGTASSSGGGMSFLDTDYMGGANVSSGPRVREYVVPGSGGGTTIVMPKPKKGEKLDGEEVYAALREANRRGALKLKIA